MIQLILMVISQDLFDVENEVFAKDCEFIEKCGLDDIVKHKQSDEVLKCFIKKMIK